jgi:bifunctional DNA-binding transcriptional regulator/antitoxin component of YhaV-PrlF toxin-antitoxin module
VLFFAFSLMHSQEWLCYSLPLPVLFFAFSLMHSQEWLCYSLLLPVLFFAFSPIHSQEWLCYSLPLPVLFFAFSPNHSQEWLCYSLPLPVPFFPFPPMQSQEWLCYSFPLTVPFFEFFPIHNQDLKRFVLEWFKWWLRRRRIENQGCRSRSGRGRLPGRSCTLSYPPATAADGSGFAASAYGVELKAMALVKVKRRYQMTLPQTLRRRARVEVGDVFDAKLEKGKITLTPHSVVDMEIAEGLEDIKGGRVYGPFETAEEMTHSLRLVTNRAKSKKGS